MSNYLGNMYDDVEEQGICAVVACPVACVGDAGTCPVNATTCIGDGAFKPCKRK